MSYVSRGFIILFFVASCFIYSGQLLDHHLHSRFVAGSFLSLLGVLYMLFDREINQVRIKGITTLGFLLTGFILLNYLSIFWANEKSEALFSAQKWLIGGAVFFIYTDIFAREPEVVLKFISKVSLITTSLILTIVSFQLYEIGTNDGFSNDVLYQLQTLFGHKSLISAFIFLLIPLNLVVVEKKSSAPVIFIVFWQVVLILLLQSRTVYLCLVLLVLILLPEIYSRRRLITRISLKHIGIMLVLLSIAFVFLNGIPDLKDRLNFRDYFKSQTATERQLVWLKTKPLIAEHWLVGVGGGNWKIEFPGHNVEGSYRMQDQNVFFTRAHNDFLEILAELGAIGLLSYLSIFVTSLVLLYKTRKQDAWKVRMLTAGVLGFMLISLIDFPKERTEFVMLISMYLAIVQCYYGKGSILGRPALVRRMLLTTLAAGLVLNLVTGASRYVGESETKKLLKARAAEDWNRVIELSKSAENRWHRLDPSSVPIAFYTGVAYYNLNEKEEAKKWFLKAHKIAPYNFHILNNLATIEIDAKEYEAAISWLEEALRINSRFEDALFNLAFCYTQAGDYGQAMEIINKVPSESDKKELFRSEINKRMIMSNDQ